MEDASNYISNMNKVVSSTEVEGKQQVHEQTNEKVGKSTEASAGSTTLSTNSMLSQDQLQRLTFEQIQEQLKLHQEELFRHQREFFMGVDGASAMAAAYPHGPLSVPSTKTTMSGNTWSFTQGLLLGQLSIFVVIAIFVKFFVFAEPSAIEAGTTNKTKDISGVIVKRNKKGGKNNRDGSSSGSGNNGDHMTDDTLSDSQSKLSSILEKTYYDVNNHNPESLDWFNVLIAQMISQLRSEALVSDNIYHSLNEFLSRGDMPDYLDTIKLTEIDVGDDFPIFSNCRIKHSEDGSGRLEAKIDVDLSDTLTLGIETKLLLNHPVPLTAVLPVQLSVSIVRFSGCLTVSLINTNDQEFARENELKKNEKENNKSDSSSVSPSSVGMSTSNSGNSNKTSENRNIPITPPINGRSETASPRSQTVEGPSPTTTTPINGGGSLSTNANGTPDDTSASSSTSNNDSSQVEGAALMFSFSPDYRLEFTVKSLIGARAKLQDVPKISTLIDSKLRSWFIERCIEPRFQVVKLPSIWPRSKNTRESYGNNVNDTRRTKGEGAHSPK
ncbi:maintenance of mitochondrial morphology protein 1 [[Candida] anglica]|uniref:Maintenance of mitochondrial morphology protein 1 n=1 Tax=[Candida] anglica TaxID=148631 RepID=A0ABP0ELP7_9ASCO